MLFALSEYPLDRVPSQYHSPHHVLVCRPIGGLLYLYTRTKFLIYLLRTSQLSFCYVLLFTASTFLIQAILWPGSSLFEHNFVIFYPPFWVFFFALRGLDRGSACVPCCARSSLLVTTIFLTGALCLTPIQLTTPFFFAYFWRIYFSNFAQEHCFIHTFYWVFYTHRGLDRVCICTMLCKVNSLSRPCFAPVHFA